MPYATSTLKMLKRRHTINGRSRTRSANSCKPQLTPPARLSFRRERMIASKRKASIAPSLT
jgi:hypothetical protein